MTEMEKKKRWEAKKAGFQKDEKKKRPALLWIILVCAGLLTGGVITYLQTGGPGESRTERSQIAAPSAGSSIVVPVSTFDDGKARFYTYKDGRIVIRYFVVKSSDGVLRAAFDACDVCWRAGKGYAQEGDAMVCRNCGSRFASVLVNEVKGGCNPAPLNRKIQDGNLIVDAREILQGKGYFDLSSERG